jgi:hypothetical protein
MSRTKRSSKRKRLAKAAALPFGAAGLGLSLVGNASASTLPSAAAPQSLSTMANQRFVLGEEEMADVSLATFHLFDRESGTAGFTQVARGCGCGHGCGGCRGCGCRGCGGCRGCRCGGCAGVGIGLGILGLGLLGGCGGCGYYYGGCGYGSCCASWGVCRYC